jgi:hypothetical protein
VVPWDGIREDSLTGIRDQFAENDSSAPVGVTRFRLLHSRTFFSTTIHYLPTLYFYCLDRDMVSPSARMR